MFQKLFESTTLDLNKIYLSPPLASIETTLRSFQYKTLNNVLFLRKSYTFGITVTGLCTLEETPISIFFDCIHIKCNLKRLQRKFQNEFILPSFAPQTTILGLYHEGNNNDNLLNHILLIFKYCIYILRE